MNIIKLLTILTVIFVCNSSLFSQQRNQTRTVENHNIKQESLIDYKITASNNAYLEIEFYPKYNNDRFDFLNELRNSDKFGEPDLGYRLFPVVLPTPNNNRIEVIDYKFKESFNAEIKPVPTPKRANNKLEMLFDYIKDNKIYNHNSFFPSQVAFLKHDGIARHHYFGSISVYPVVYNPVTKTIKKYSYIKFRVTFGENPIILNKSLSIHEIDLLRGIAVNSDVASNWSTIEFNKINENPLLQNSVLSSGDFYKIEVKESGIYKIDKNFLQNAGINVNNIDPKTIKIYGNGGKELPYNIYHPVPTDLIENEIYVEGEDDHSFDDNDYILFYGKSPNDWDYNSTYRRFTHYIHHYSVSNYYWITFGGSNGIRVPLINSPNIPNLTPASYFIERFFEEPEVNNLGSTGTLWLSQRIGAGESFIFNRQLTGYVDGSDVGLRFRFGNASSETATFLVEDRNSNFSNLIPVGPVSGSFSHINLYLLETNYSLNPGNKSIDLSLSLPTQYNSLSISGYYDYYEIQYRRSFTSVYENKLRFNSINTNSISLDTNILIEYQVSTFTTPDIKIFKVDDDKGVNLINPISYIGGSVRFQDYHSQNNPKEYYVIGGDQYKAPVSISSKIPNQNLHGISDGASFVIISPTEFLSAANRLKAQREIPGPNYLKTIIVDINQIFNEFSGGLLDPVAMRNFLIYANTNWNERPVYVLFLGDGSYDYKNIYNLSIKNFIPPIEKSTDHIDEITSYPSDDFITEINESVSSPVACRPDFSHGRITTNSLDQTNIVIDKILAYESPLTNDIWKKKIMYVADDGWTTSQNQGQEHNIHTNQSEDIAENYTPKDFEKEKIYIVVYPAVITPQGRRKPGANIDIIKGWNEGRLVINYVGHGSSDLWAHEHIFDKNESIPKLHNKNKYPFVTIASCDLARWDDPYLISAAEALLISKDKGAIGVIAAVRPVYSSSNARFNNKLWQNFMYVKDTLNLPVRIGRAMYNVKHQLNPITDNDTKYSLISDPTLRVSIPQHITRIDSINNTPGTDTAQIKALQKVRISGSILRPDSSFWNNYNGNITIKVFDVPKHVTFIDFGYTFNFVVDGGTIFIGNTGVANGKWSIEFIVPRDISYETGNGKLLAYFSNSNSDGSGYTNKFVLNGIDSTAAVDTTGPDITVYMGDRNFRSGDLINQNSKIIADFYDFSGINLTGTIGHKIEAIINEDENNKIDLTPYYNSTSGYQYGTLEYPIEGISDGKYKVKIKAWDTYNNYNVSSADYVVMNSSELKVENIYNYPNPMTDNTSFLFQHNLDVPLNTEIKIYTVSGRLIKVLNKTNITDKFVTINWDGKDTDGDMIANGMYIYKVIIKSTDGNFSTNSTGKLAKLK